MPDVRIMRGEEKIAEALRRSGPFFPLEFQEFVKELLKPEMLAIATATIVVWATSHAAGVGFIFDAILLGVGVMTFGLSLLSVAKSWWEFITLAWNAQTEADLDRAARSFAEGGVMFGVAGVTAVLLKRPLYNTYARNGLTVVKIGSVGRVPANPPTVIIANEGSLPAGALGTTDAWGNIRIVRGLSPTQHQLTFYHEWVHSVLSPRFGPLSRLQVQLRANAYQRSAFLKYLEEAMAESFAQVRVNGLKNIFVGIRFPVANDYVSISRINYEVISAGNRMGNIMVDGMLLSVIFEVGPAKKLVAASPQ